MPGTNERIDYDNKWVSKAESAWKPACKACDLEGEGYEYLATDEWKKIFGQDFWYPV